MINVMNIHQFAQHFHNEQLASANRVRGIFPHLGHTGHRGEQGENGAEFDDMAQPATNPLGNALERAMEAHRRKVLGDPQSQQPAGEGAGESGESSGWGRPRNPPTGPTGSSTWGQPNPQEDLWGDGPAQPAPGRHRAEPVTRMGRFADAARALDANIGRRMWRL